jgi:Rho-binding antiterminator
MVPEDAVLVDYGDSVDAVLRTIGSPDGGAGSGSAAALALSLGIECLALHVALTKRSGDDDPGRRADLERLAERLHEWRALVRLAFAEDGDGVARMIGARRSRDRSEGEEERAAVAQEIRALREATIRLLSLVDVGQSLRAEAGLMLESRGVAHARAESATSIALAEAAIASLRRMIEANVETLGRRCGRYGLGCDEVAELRQAIGPYEPVDCSFHDRLEDAATRRRSCRIRYRTPWEREYEVTTTIEDVWSRAGGEFVRLGTGAVVRLDDLAAIDD